VKLVPEFVPANTSSKSTTIAESTSFVLRRLLKESALSFIAINSNHSDLEQKYFQESLHLIKQVRKEVF